MLIEIGIGVVLFSYPIYLYLTRPKNIPVVSGLTADKARAISSGETCPPSTAQDVVDIEIKIKATARSGKYSTNIHRDVNASQRRYLRDRGFIISDSLSGVNVSWFPVVDYG